MSKTLGKYIITTGNFDKQTNSIRTAKRLLKEHAAEMKERYPNDHDAYAIYMLIEKVET